MKLLRDYKTDTKRIDLINILYKHRGSKMPNFLHYLNLDKNCFKIDGNSNQRF